MYILNKYAIYEVMICDDHKPQNNSKIKYCVCVKFALQSFIFQKLKLTKMESLRADLSFIH